MAEILDIEIQQGDSFDWEITIVGDDGLPMDLTALSFRGMGRKTFSDALPLFSFICTKADQVTKKGLLVVTLTAATTALLVEKKGVYDIEAYTANDALVKKVYKGAFSTPFEATK